MTSQPLSTFSSAIRLAVQSGGLPILPAAGIAGLLHSPNFSSPTTYHGTHSKGYTYLRNPQIRHMCAAASASSPDLSPEVKELADRICQLSLSDAVSLTTTLKDRLGIANIPMAAPMQAMAAPAAAPAAAAADSGEEVVEEKKVEKKVVDIVLKMFDSANKLKVIKELRGLTDIGLKEAKELIERAPVVLKEQVKIENAQNWKSKLEAVGASIDFE